MAEAHEEAFEGFGPPDPACEPAAGRPDRGTASLLLEIERATGGRGGEDYLRALTEALSRVLDLRAALVARLVGDPPSQAEALWVAREGVPTAPFCYELRGTPCEEAAAGRLCIHARDVTARFPADPILRELDACSYAGSPLRSRDGRIFGLIALVGHEPLREPDTVAELLALLSARAALELDRVESDDRLRVSERRLRTLAEHLPGVPFQVVYDEAFTPLFLAGRIEELTGWPKEAFLSGRIGIPQLFHPEDAAWVAAALDSAIDRHRPLHLVHRIVTRAGRTRWVEVRGAARKDEQDGLLLIEGIVLDVTERKRAEEEIRESYHRYRTMFEDNWAAKVLLDPADRSIVDLNGAAAALFACERRELLGRPILRYLREADPGLDRLLSGEAVGGTPPGDAVLTDARGRRRLVQLFTGPLRVAGKDLVYVILHDVTELRRAEEERRALEEKVEQAERIESLGMLAGGVAHDFNNLLVGILANAEVARELAADRPQLAGPLADIEQAATRAAELVSQLLAYAGRAKLRREPLRLRELAEETIGLLGALLRPYQPVEIEGDPDVFVEGDATRLRQVVLNLLTNAAEATAPQPGGLGLRVASFTADQALRLPDDERLPPGEYAVLEVWDRGQGIPEPLRRRIFDPFFSTKFDGRGLGLAAVAGIVRGHGGTVTVEPREGGGTVFRVLLPRSAAAASAGEGLPARSGTPGRGASRRVLVVDDEAIVRRTARLCLERAGYVVEEAESCRKALERIAGDREGVDCVLLDLVMPDAGDDELLRALEAREPAVPVVLMSGYSPEAAKGGPTSGPAMRSDLRFLAKPFRARDLVAAVEAAIADS